MAIDELIYWIIKLQNLIIAFWAGCVIIEVLATKINHFHERFPHIVYSDSGSSFEQMLDKDEVSKYMCGPSQPNFSSVTSSVYYNSSNIFEKRTNVCSLRNLSVLLRPKFHNVVHGDESCYICSYVKHWL